MPYGLIDFSDITKRTGSDAAVGLVDEVLTTAPELSVIPGRPINGTSYKTTVRTGLAPSGFRAANEGVDPGKSSRKQVTVECAFLDCQLEADESIVSADPGDIGDVLTEEALSGLESEVITVGRQLYYGKKTFGDAKGFPGLVDSVDASMLVDAGGDAAAGCTSVWFVAMGIRAVHFVWGKEQGLQIPDAWMKQQIVKPDGKKFMGYVNNVHAWIGLQVAHKFCVGRIHSIDVDSPLTRKLLNQMYQKFPVAMRANLRIFMNRTSEEQLIDDASLVGKLVNDGAEVQLRGDYKTVPDFRGVQIVPTDSLVDTEEPV